MISSKNVVISNYFFFRLNKSDGKFAAILMQMLDSRKKRFVIEEKSRLF
jgi:hypothetical protein